MTFEELEKQNKILKTAFERLTTVIYCNNCELVKECGGNDSSCGALTASRNGYMNHIIKELEQ